MQSLCETAMNYLKFTFRLDATFLDEAEPIKDFSGTAT